MHMNAEQVACWMMKAVVCVRECLDVHTLVCVQLELTKDDERETEEGEDDKHIVEFRKVFPLFLYLSACVRVN